MKAPKVFGQVIRQMREKLGVSQEDMAHRAGLDRSYYGKLECGRYQPTLTTLLAIGRALKVPASAILIRVERVLADK